MATPVEQAMERITKLPVPQKVAILVGTVAAITAGNYFLFVQDSLNDFDKGVKEMQGLEDKMIQNQQIAKNLNQYRRQKEALEQELAKALLQLPEDANIEGLIDSLNDMGSKAGLAMNTIEPKPETKGPDGLYAEIPIALTVSGNYHEIAVFFDSVRQLKRVINITNIKLMHPHTKNEKILVDASYTATAFRFIPQKGEGGDKDKDKGKGKDKDKDKEDKK
jgi:type IV pilus assembly protein PilO